MGRGKVVPVLSITLCRRVGGVEV